MSHELDTGLYISIREVLKRFLKLSGYFDAISNLKHLSHRDEPFSNVVQEKK